VTILKYERKLKGKEAWKKLEEREKEIEKAKKYIDLGNSPVLFYEWNMNIKVFNVDWKKPKK